MVKVRKKLVIALERDPATELAARILRREELLKGALTTITTKTVPLRCFLCGRAASRRGQGSGGVAGDDVGEVFAKAIQEYSHDASNYDSWTGETCPSCFALMEDVVALQGKIEAMREEIRVLVEKAVGLRGSGGRDLALDPDAPEGRAKKRRRTSSPRRPLQDHYVTIKDEDDSSSPENDNESPLVFDASSECRCEPPMVADKEGGGMSVVKAMETATTTTEGESPPSPRQRPLRKSRLKAENVLKTSLTEGESEGEEDREEEDFEPPADSIDSGSGADSEDSEGEAEDSVPSPPPEEETGPLQSCPEPGCLFKTTNKSHFRTHCKHAHTGIPVRRNKPKKRKGSPFSCSICGKSYPWKTGLQRHLQSIHNLNRKEEKVGEEKAALLASLHIVREGLGWKCMNENCGKLFKFARCGIGHAQNFHLKQRNYVCEICGEAFYHPFVYKQHKWKKHEKVRSRPCRKCGKNFPSERYRVVHEITVCKVDVPAEEMEKHSLKLLYCSFEGCNRVYADPASLRGHVAQLHSEERPFKCTVCDKAFKLQDQRKTHEKTHQEPLKRHSCEYCDASYRYKCHLQDHIRTKHLNEPKTVVCEVCGGTFYDSSGLRRHKRRIHETVPSKKTADENDDLENV